MTVNGSCVVLFSGGLDSTTALYVARQKGLDVHALTLDYGQLHRREVASAKKIARHLKIPHQILKLALPWRGSALLDSSIQLPKGKLTRGIPVTYVPARNTIFLALALSWAEVIEASSIWIGANAIDYSGYPDCRGDYLKAAEKVFQLGTQIGREGQGISIEAPLIHKTKADIVRLARSLGVPFEWTWSCYEGKDRPCGECDSCVFRAKGFKEAGIADPLFTSCKGAALPNRPREHSSLGTK